MINILFIGDIFGKTGIKAIEIELPKIKQKYNIDFVIANGENTTNGKGMSLADYEKLCKLGIDFFTFGNHTWGNEDYCEVLQKNNVIRPYNVVHSEDKNITSDIVTQPYNYKNANMYEQYGQGFKIIEIKNKKFLISNFLGKSVFFRNPIQTNPFIKMDQLIEKNYDSYDYHITDFHAETTSEKNAFLYKYNGKIDCILGTHTHVQTADEIVLNNTGFITDVGMTGSYTGIIGAKGNEILEMFEEKRMLFKLNADNGKYQFCAVVVSFDEDKKGCKSIERINIKEI